MIEPNEDQLQAAQEVCPNRFHCVCCYRIAKKMAEREERLRKALIRVKFDVQELCNDPESDISGLELEQRIEDALNGVDGTL